MCTKSSMLASEARRFVIFEYCILCYRPMTVDNDCLWHSGRRWSPPTPLCKPRTSIPYFPRYNMSNYGLRAFSYAGLQLYCWKCAEIDIYSHLQTISKDVFIRADYAFSALETIFFVLLAIQVYFLILILRQWWSIAINEVGCSVLLT